MTAQSTEPGAGYRADCLQSVEILRGWPQAAWPALVAALDDQRPLLLVGEGSSRLFPAAFARFLARRWGLAGRIDDCGGREAEALALERYRVLFASNSGKTRELVELARRGVGGALALLGSDGGDLARLVPERRCVLLRSEVAVAATASVVGQALALTQALAERAARPVPSAALADGVEAVLRGELPAAVRERIAGAAGLGRIWWGDGGSGEGGELALKTMETVGVPGIYAPGTLLLHGVEEVLGPHDLVVWFDAPAADRPLLGKALVAGAGAMVITAGGPGDDWPLPDVGDWSAIVHLAAGWRLLGELAEGAGRDPDKPKRARKVGNPA